MSGKLINPIYNWLSESVLTDNLIASQKNDTASWGLSLCCDFLYSKSKLKAEVLGLAEQIASTNYKVKDALAMAIVVFLSQKHSISLPKNFFQNSKEVISQLGGQKVPTLLKVETYFFAKQVNQFSIADLKVCLEGLQRDAIERRNFSDLIEVEHALGSEYFSTSIWSDPINVEGLGVSKRSKLGLLEIDCGAQNTSIAVIEKKTWERINDASLPTISLLVYEAEKLISTNLESTELGNVLNVLQKGNTSWAQLITDIQASGVTVDINRLNRVPSLSIDESVWALLLLNGCNRKETYQITQEEKEQLDTYKQILSTKENLIPQKAIAIFSIVSLVIFFLVGYYFASYGISKIIEGFSNIPALEATRIVPETFGDLWSPVIVLVLVTKYLIYSWRYLIEKRDFNLRAAFLALFFIIPKD